MLRMLSKVCSWVVALLCLILGIPAFAQSNSSSAGGSPPAARGALDQLPARFVQMLNTQVAWDNGLNNPTGPRLRFVKFSDLTGADGHFTAYRLYAEGAQEGTPYVFAVWKIGAYLKDLKVISSSAYVNRRGLLLTRKPAKDEEDSESVGGHDEFDVDVQAANGEPIRFILRSKDDKIIIPGTLVPFPIESQVRTCKLQALLAVPEGQAILIYGDGFPPNSEVEVNGNSAGELKKSESAVDAKGHLKIVELPFVAGKDSGSFKETVSAEGCATSVEIPWGKGTYQKH